MIRNKTIWITNKIGEDDSSGVIVPKYGEPFKIITSLSDVSGEAEVREYGDRVFRMIKTILPYRYNKKISEGDLAYIHDSVEPNFTVVAVRAGNLKVRVYFERMVGK